MKKIAIIAASVLVSSCIPSAATAADDYCVDSTTVITDANGVMLSKSGQLIDRVCGLSGAESLTLYYVRKGFIGAAYVALAKEAVDGTSDGVKQVVQVLGQ